MPEEENSLYVLQELILLDLTSTVITFVLYDALFWMTVVALNTVG